ncbi:hypothetical protein GJAV_G00029460 [Gymnothorax javanicus]|nr:hypothetical protein GJAV_G00029460 [Gymnothorax javanicus]
MFNHHQQLQQHLLQLQQLFQHPQPPPATAPPRPPSHPMTHHHHHQQHPVGRPIPAPSQAPPRHMVRLRSVSQNPIMAANPMLQGALLMQRMQGSMQGFAVGGQQMAPFISAGPRHSLLGPAPMGVAVKTPRMGFPPRHFPPQTPHYQKDFASRQAERRKENELKAFRPTDGQSEANKVWGENSIRAASTEGAVAADKFPAPSAQAQEEPALKRRRSEGTDAIMEEPTEANGAPGLDYKALVEDEEPADAVTLDEKGSITESETIEFMEESRAPEVVGVGATLKVTIQHSSESRAFNTGLEEQSGGGTGAGQGETRDLDGNAAAKYFCYICGTSCHTQQNFQNHMNGLTHQQRMMEIQHMSNACLVSLLPRVRESLESAQGDGEKRPGPQRWCATCQTHFYGDLILHRRTKEHKLSKHSSRPFCTVCKRHFRTPRKFVEHMKSPEHKQRVEELREEGLPEVLEELITVDAVGCFEGEEDYEEEPSELEEEEKEQQGHSHTQTVQKEVLLEDMADNEEYDPDTQYGSSFVVPVAGFLCRLCHKFYHFESTARHSHCQSLAHFQNLQKYRALRRQEDTSEPDSCSDHKEETQAVTEKEVEEPEAKHRDPAGFPPELGRRTVQSHDHTKDHSSHSRLTNSGGAALSNLSITVCRPTAKCKQAPGDQQLGSADLPPAPNDHGTKEEKDTAASPPSPSPCVQQTDSMGEGGPRRPVPDQQDPVSEDRELLAPEDLVEEELQDVVSKEANVAMGHKRTAAGKRLARTMWK